MANTAPPDPEARRRIEHLETLIQNLERLPDPAARDQARELVQTLLDFHGAALARILGRVADMGDPGRALITALADDDIVSSLLLLYGLHPLDLETRVEQALERVRPYLRSHTVTSSWWVSSMESFACGCKEAAMAAPRRR